MSGYGGIPFDRYRTEGAADNSDCNPVHMASGNKRCVVITPQEAYVTSWMVFFAGLN